MKTPSAKILLIVLAVLMVGSAVFFYMMSRPVKVMTGEVVPNEQVYQSNDESMLAKKNRMRALKVNSEALFEKVNGGKDTLSLELFDNVQFTVKIKHREKSSFSERLIIQGTVEDKPNSQVVMTVSKSDLAGSITLEDGTTYRLTPAGNGVCKVFEEDPSKLGECKDYKNNPNLQALGLPSKTDDGRKIGYAQQVIFIGSGGYGRTGSGYGTISTRQPLSGVPNSPWAGGTTTTTPQQPPTTFSPPSANSPYGGSTPSGNFYTTPVNARTTLRRLSPLSLPNKRPLLTVTNAFNPPPGGLSPNTPTSTYPPPITVPGAPPSTTSSIPGVGAPTNGHGGTTSGPTNTAPGSGHGAGTPGATNTVPGATNTAPGSGHGTGTPGATNTTSGVPPGQTNQVPVAPPTTPTTPSVPGTQPAGTQPAGTQPAGTQPAGTQPAGAQPTVTGGTNTSVLPPPSSVLPPSSVPPGSAVGNGTVDVLVLYTEDTARCVARTPEDGTVDYSPVVTAIAQAMAEMSTAVAASRATNCQVRLVGTAKLDYKSTKDVLADLGRLRVNSAATALRERYKADLVALVVTNNSSSTMGVGNYVPGSTTGNWLVFHSVIQAKALSSYSLAHELGHNMGCMHGTGGGASAGNGPYPFSHGHRFKSFHTIMSYASGGSKRIPHYSSPTVKYMGNVTGKAGSSDNAQSLSLMAPYISAYMPRAGGGSSSSANTNSGGGGSQAPPGAPPEP